MPKISLIYYSDISNYEVLYIKDFCCSVLFEQLVNIPVS